MGGVGEELSLSVRVRTLERKLRFRSNRIWKAKKFLKKLFGFCSFPMRLSRKTNACGALVALVLRTSHLLGYIYIK
jgi:hypothetical protein